MPSEAEGEDEAPVNQASALWARAKSELTEQDYKDFYKHVAGDFTDPLAWVHSKIEGTYEYTLLLFIRPARPSTCTCRRPAGASSCTSGGSSSWRTRAS